MRVAEKKLELLSIFHSQGSRLAPSSSSSSVLLCCLNFPLCFKQRKHDEKTESKKRVRNTRRKGGCVNTIHVRVRTLPRNLFLFPSLPRGVKMRSHFQNHLKEKATCLAGEVRVGEEE